MRRLKESLPEFYQEIVDSLSDIGRIEIAEQMDTLTLERFTNDESVGAMYLYAGEQRELNQVEQNVIGAKHGECVSLGELAGMVVIDLDNFGRVMGVEVIDRPDVAKMLRGIGG